MQKAQCKCYDGWLRPATTVLLQNGRPLEEPASREAERWPEDGVYVDLGGGGASREGGEDFIKAMVKVRSRDG